MKAKLRFIALALAVAFMVAAAGCAQTSAPAQSAAAAPTTAAPETAAPTQSAETQDPKLITFPYTGPEITFKYLWADVGQGAKITDEMVVAKAITAAVGNIKLDMELLPWTDYDTKQAMYLSSGEVPDMMIARDVLTVVRTYGENQIFLDYAPLMEKYMPNLVAVRDKYTLFDMLTNTKGNLYGLPCNLQDADYEMEGWYYNKTLFDKHNIAVPTTQAELLETLRAIKAADPNVIPYNNTYGIPYLTAAMSNMFDSIDSGVQWNRETKKWEFGPTLPDSQFKSFLQFVNTLWKEGLVNPEVSTATDEQIQAQYQQGNWGITYYYFGIEDQGKLSVQAEPMLCPVGDSGSAYGGVTAPYDGTPYWGLCSGAKTENPEILAQLVNFMFGEEFTTLRNWGIKDVTYTVDANGNKQFAADVKTGLNPTGTKTTDMLGFGVSPFDRTFGYSEIEAGKLLGNNALGYKAQKMYDEAFASGRIKARYGQATPTVTPEESEEISGIMTPVQTYLDESVNKFIMGEQSFDEWDAFLTKLQTLGNVQRVLDIFNSKETIVFSGNWSN